MSVMSDDIVSAARYIATGRLCYSSFLFYHLQQTTPRDESIIPSVYFFENQRGGARVNENVCIGGGGGLRKSVYCAIVLDNSILRHSAVPERELEL